MLTPAPLISVEDVRAAARAIAGHVANTPFLHSETLSGYCQTKCTAR